MPASDYDRNVFINCPFDAAYAPIFEALVFAVQDAGYRATCARERLSNARYSIHDLSRTELDESNALPRFNMPLEYISDLSGQDIHQHSNNPQVAMTRVRDWLRAESGRDNVPGGTLIYRRYQAFRGDLPQMCERLNLDVNDLTFVDFSYAIAMWLSEQR